MCQFGEPGPPAAPPAAKQAADQPADLAGHLRSPAVHRLWLDLLALGLQVVLAAVLMPLVFRLFL